MSYRFFITRPIPPAAGELLAAAGSVTERPADSPISSEELATMAGDCDGILAMLTDRFDATTLAKLPRLRAISNYAVGFNNIDIAECTRRRIGVSNTPDVLTDASAELAWALLMATARRIGEAERHVRQGDWNGWGPMQFLGRQVTGKKLGIIGPGRIGQRVARMAAGFDMEIGYVSREPKSALDAAGARRMPLRELLGWADFVSLHVVLNDATHHLIGSRELALMKSSAVLINTSRGPVIDETALVEALAAGRLFAAGLDVYEFEPKIGADLLKLPNVVLLPHIGSATVETRSQMAKLAAENLLAMVRGHRPACPVNAELWGVAEQ